MNSVNFGWFVSSQTVYNIGAFLIMSMLFELRFRKHIWVVIVISALSSITNYLVYFNSGEVKMGFIVPIISTLITFFYLSAVVKVPTLWSFVVTVTGGVIIPTIIQLGLAFLSFGYFMPYELKEHIWKNYALDIISGLFCSLIAIVLYTRGWSFRFDFDKLRFKWERITVIVMTVCATISLPTAIIIINIHDITIGLTFLSISSFIAFILLLGYALKKEKDENDFLNTCKEVKEHD